MLLAPASAKSPNRIPDLSDPAVRAEFTPASIKAFVRLSEFWRLTAKQASALLGKGSERSYYRIKGPDWEGTLSQDALTRISAMVGIYKGLHLLFSSPLADEWVRKPNTDELFAGVAPVEHMIVGGIPAMLEVRNYVDALRGGL